MNKERYNLIKRSEYPPKTSITRLTAWLGLRLLADADLRDWRSSWQLFSHSLALGVAQNDFWDKRRGFDKRELPENGFGIWQKEIEPDFTFASFYQGLVRWVEANYKGRKRFVRKKILAAWQKKACQLEIEQAKINLETVGLNEGWKIREETIRIATWGMTSLACGKEIPEDDSQFLRITKLVLAIQIVDDIVGLGSDWKRNQITFATLALNHCQNAQEKNQLVEAIKKGDFIPSKLSQNAPEIAGVLRKKTNEYLNDLQESSLKLELAKLAVKGLVRYYPAFYNLIKEKRNNGTFLEPILEFLPQTFD